MRAEDNTVRVSVKFQVSETDQKDGVKVGDKLKGTIRAKFNEDVSYSLINVFQQNDGLKDSFSGEDFLNFKNAKVAKYTSDSNIEFLVASGKTELASGSWDEVKSVDLSDYTSIVVTMSYTYNVVGADNVADDVDDRLQTTYSVRVETGIDSGLYKRPQSYTVNNTDDLAKLVANGDYTNLPGLYDVAYDSDDNEYVLVYTIDGDDIYANWEKASGVKARVVTKGSTSTGPVDLDGDGKISCDEYYGTTGLEWSDKLNACVVSSTGDAVVTIPNTATR